MCIIIDKIIKRDLNQKNYTHWNELNHVVVYSMLETFIFPQGSFYYRMMKTLINRLIETGVMSHIVQYEFPILGKPLNDDKPKVLKLDQLSFGFNIWLVSCGVSVATFMFERFYKLYKTLTPKHDTIQKAKFAKIHPMEMSIGVKDKSAAKIYTETYYDKFKVKNCYKIEQTIEDLNEIELINEIEQSVMTDENE